MHIDTDELEACLAQYESIGALLRARAHTSPDRVFFSWESHTITYEQIYCDARRVGQTLTGLGLTKGDRVAIMMAPSPDWLTVWFGAALIGVVIVPINTAHLGEGLLHQLRDSQPSVLIIDDDLVTRIEAIRAELSIDDVFVRGVVSAPSPAARAEASARGCDTCMDR